MEQIENETNRKIFGTNRKIFGTNLKKTKLGDFFFL